MRIRYYYVYTKLMTSTNLFCCMHVLVIRRLTVCSVYTFCLIWMYVHAHTGHSSYASAIRHCILVCKTIEDYIYKGNIVTKMKVYLYSYSQDTFTLCIDTSALITWAKKDEIKSKWVGVSVLHSSFLALSN